VEAQGTTNKQNLDDAEWLQSRAGERICIRIPSATTNGAYSVTEIISSPGDSTSVHIHHNEDEHFLILEGTVRFLRGEESFEASAGAMISMHRGTVHAWGNASNAPIRMLIIFSPGGPEEMLRQIAIAGKDIDLLALSRQFAVSIVGPRLLG
jgi:quercetin dioxygenase-like cupin family protein